jgi:hypothetical protein
MVVNMNVEWKSGGLYLSTTFLTLYDLLTTEVGYSTYSSDSVDSYESYSSFFISNHTVSGLFSV